MTPSEFEELKRQNPKLNKLPIIDIGKEPVYEELFSEQIEGVQVKYFLIQYHYLTWAIGEIAYQIDGKGKTFSDYKNVAEARNIVRKYWPDG